MYLNDILIYLENKKEHVECHGHIEQVMQI